MQAFQFPQWNEVGMMCPFCRASGRGPNYLFTDCRIGAGWRRTIWTHHEYIKYLKDNGFAIPVLLALVIGLRLECITPDVLHTVDQGVASHIIGNVLWFLAITKAVFGGSNQQQKIERLARHLNQWYNDVKESYRIDGKLTLERLRPKGLHRKRA